MTAHRRALPVRFVAVLGVVGLLIGCTDDGERTAPTTTTAPAVRSSGTVPSTGTAPSQEFCTALRELATGGITDPESLPSIYSRLESNAPTGIKDEVETFVARSRAISDAIIDATDEEGNIDVGSALDSLTTEQREFVDDLAESSRTGDYPPGPAGTVLRYFGAHCP